MQRGKTCMRMLGEHVIALCHQVRQGRELRSVKTPVGMFNEFFITLVAGIDGMEEGLGIGYMNEDGNAKAAALVPHGIETRVIYGNEFPAFVTHAEAEFFQDLESASASS